MTHLSAFGNIYNRHFEGFIRLFVWRLDDGDLDIVLSLSMVEDECTAVFLEVASLIKTVEYQNAFSQLYMCCGDPFTLPFNRHSAISAISSAHWKLE